MQMQSVNKITEMLNEDVKDAEEIEAQLLE